MDLIIEIDALAGTVTEREMTSDEKAQRVRDQAAANKAEAEMQAQKALAQQARQKIAQTSGLTVEEMAALGF